MNLFQNTSMQFKLSPSPADFDVYLPWACQQLEILYVLVIQKTQAPQNLVKSRRSTISGNIKKVKIKTEEEMIPAGDPITSIKMELKSDNAVIVKTFYDSANNLTQVYFYKNNYVPDEILQLMSLIVQFHACLTTITIDSGLDQHGLYTIRKILSMSNITNVILDNTMIPQAIYYLLLEGNHSLTYLSLSRCSLNDLAVEKIAKALVKFPLFVLNLSSNRITDLGAMHFANTLRTNRKLIHLNLAGNMITDDGAESILNTLMEFPLTKEEAKEKKMKYIDYLKKRKDLEIKKEHNFVTDICLVSTKSTLFGDRKTQPNISYTISESKLDPFCETFTQNDLVVRDEVLYCLGNNILSNLNLAYNNISHRSVRRLYKVLCYQQAMKRKPKGLIRVCIEGNKLPDKCKEFHEISRILNTNMNITPRPQRKSRIIHHETN